MAKYFSEGGGKNGFTINLGWNIARVCGEVQPVKGGSGGPVALAKGLPGRQQKIFAALYRIIHMVVG